MSRITPLVLAVALFMEQMDSTVIATSLPAIAADIGTSPIALKLALTAYLVALATFIPIAGWMSDKFGAKAVFRVAMVVFLLGSVSCAFADSLPAFVASRFIQGMGGSMMTPVARLLLVRTTPRSDLVNAMLWLTIPSLIGPIVGPPVGGFITTYFSWHWIFIINLPIGLLGIIFAGRFLPPDDRRTPPPIDRTGFVITTIGFPALIFGLSVISMPALPLEVGYVTALVGVVAIAFYVWHARRTEHPLLDLRLFRDRMFRTSVLAGGIARLSVGAMPFLLPLMLQLFFGMTPFEAGLITLFGALGPMTSKFIAQRVYRRIGFKYVLMTNAWISGLGFAALALFNEPSQLWLMFPLLYVSSLLRSMFFTGVNATTFADVEEKDAAQASVISSVVQQMTLAMSVALAGTILEVSHTLRGDELALIDFHIDFLVIGAISAVAGLVFLSWPRDAGANLTVKRRTK